MLDHEYQHMAANAIAHAADMCQRGFQDVIAGYGAPSAIYRPTLTLDGSQWRALYGDNIQEGVAGFGASPREAMHDFNANWDKRLEQS